MYQMKLREAEDLLQKATAWYVAEQSTIPLYDIIYQRYTSSGRG